MLLSRSLLLTPEYQKRLSQWPPPQTSIVYKGAIYPINISHLSLSRSCHTVSGWQRW